MILSMTWSLTEMCKTHLNSERGNYDPEDTASKLEGSVTSPIVMLEFVHHCELDAHLFPDGHRFQRSNSSFNEAAYESCWQCLVSFKLSNNLAAYLLIFCPGINLERRSGGTERV
jgi:hypothetical protein